MIDQSRLKKDYYTPREAADLLGMNCRTLSNKVRAGLVPAERSATNRIMIHRDTVIELLKKADKYVEETDDRRDVIYARVSSHGQKAQGNLDRQILDILTFASDLELCRPLVLKDVGSGLNTKRKNLKKLMDMAKSHEIKRIFITHKDRLTRFGYEYLEAYFALCEVEIIILQEAETKEIQEELVEDMMSLLASFSGKMYRIRGNQKKKMREAVDSIAVTETE